MAEHMRIALLDPKWKEKSGLTKPGEKDDTLAKGDVVGDNLKRLAQKRKDIFGTDEVGSGVRGWGLVVGGGVVGDNLKRLVRLRNPKP